MIIGVLFLFVIAYIIYQGFIKHNKTLMRGIDRLEDQLFGAEPPAPPPVHSREEDHTWDYREHYAFLEWKCTNRACGEKRTAPKEHIPDYLTWKAEHPQR